MMNKLIEEVSELTQREYERAAQSHGPINHSTHESYAVLKEECEEARDETLLTELYLDKYWKSVRQDDYREQVENLEVLFNKALLAACEYIQTAAMALKGLETIRQTQVLGAKIERAIKASQDKK